jgi:transmembrane sensor
MSAPAPSDMVEDGRLAEAAAWRARLAEQKLDSDPALEDWLASDPLNAAAYERAEAIWDEMGELSSTPEFMDLRRGALDIAARQGRRNRGAYRSVRPVAAALATLALAGAGVGTWWMVSRPQTYETTRGERRVVPLSDGSQVWLDSDSKVAVRYSSDARKLELLRGQARFDVAHNVARPFSVKARDETVVATGTSFNIDLTGSDTLVTLIEGRVAVLGGTGDGSTPTQTRQQPSLPHTVELVAGQELDVTAAAAPVIKTVDLERATAWEDGRLVFEDEPLGMAALRISRSSARRVSVDPAVAKLRISGVFNAGDVDGFAQTMSLYLPVRAEAGADGGLVLVAR